MSDRCYLEKCRDRLYAEFVLGGVAMDETGSGELVITYESGQDLLRKTPDLFDSIQRQRLEGEFDHAYRYIEDVFDGANPYFDAIQQNFAFLAEVIASNDVTLETTDVSPNKFGYYLMADSQAFVPLFGGSQGNLCLGSPIVRFSKAVKFSGPQGVITLALDLTSLPQGTVFQPGQTWNFQLWFRDVNPGPTSNTSDGLAITFQ